MKMRRAAECAREEMDIWRVALQPSHPDVIDAEQKVTSTGDNKQYHNGADSVNISTVVHRVLAAASCVF
jgi:hypothetical protein